VEIFVVWIAFLTDPPVGFFTNVEWKDCRQLNNNQLIMRRISQGFYDVLSWKAIHENYLLEGKL
jgi:hypothetical protein